MNEELSAVIRQLGYQISGGSLLDLADCDELLAFQPKANGYVFGCVRLKSGKVAALWETHGQIGGSLNELLGDAEHDPALNNHERTLVAYGVK